ncbi:hypothetical protein ADL22_10030 [Streptomyces sp. NRRL F-4489]|uniref:DUF1648 domain-containing protein n=1 Tax=Streptomyces sp. NRRL F-4489 TaxID=1609095 RepID=UPI000748EF43|nr:DUF1648 domain-containing protein [Streptomyces sp. NRRL F-4489]KUL47397.1 hypothetical protein ADL22_10030 [Streptomyces sp. NRRL F-4489]
MKRFPSSASSAPSARVHPRGWLAALPFLVVTLVLGGLYAGTAGRLPERLATHFGPDGRPDGYSSAPGFLLACLAVLLVLGIGFSVPARFPMAPPNGRLLVATAYFTAPVLGYPAALVLLGNAGAGAPDAVRLPAWQMAAVLAGGAVLGGLGWLLAGADPARRPAASGPAGRLDLPAGVRAGWSRTVSSLPLAALALVTVCGGAVLGARAGWVGGAVLILGGVSVGVHCSVRVTVDRRGLTLTPALLPVPLRRIPLAKVAEATSRRISALAEYGGWGYRVRPGGSGLLLRSGEALVLRLTSGREFVVTVDDAATAAALLNTCLDRRRSGEGD